MRANIGELRTFFGENVTFLCLIRLLFGCDLDTPGLKSQKNKKILNKILIYENYRTYLYEEIRITFITWI
jgi:hypothetical protein